MRKFFYFFWVFTVFFATVLFNFGSISEVYAGRCGFCAAETGDRCSACLSAYYCTAKCLSDHRTQHKEFCRAMKPYKALAGGVEIRASALPGTGRGLFALREFVVGAPVAVYTGPQVERKSVSPSLVLFAKDPYLQEVGDKMISGAVHPASPHLGAQMANDADFRPEHLPSLLSLNCADPDLALIRAITLDYLGRTGQNANVINKDGSPVFVATKAIHRGDEIFNFYGLEYWLTYPIKLCGLKGYPVQSLKIEVAVSAAVEDFISTTPRARGVAPAALYSFYQPREVREIRVREMEEYCSRNPLNAFALRLGILFGEVGYLRIEGMDVGRFSAMAEELRLEDRLAAIGQEDSPGFFTATGTMVPHRRSKDLLREMIARGLPFRFVQALPVARPLADEDLARMIE